MLRMCKKNAVIDDWLLYDDDITSNFFSVCRYLSLCARGGVVFNPKKFVFCQKTVEFAGFEVGDGKIKPGRKMLQAIEDIQIP